MKKRLQISLFLLRLSVFIVLFMWTIDKFINPGHAAAVFAKFYFIDGLSAAMASIVGAVQLIIIVAFLFGVKKRLSYAAVLLMHLVSTLSPILRYFDPWTSPNLLFFAAWPMLAAITALYLLREEDSLFTLKQWSN